MKLTNMLIDVFTAAEGGELHPEAIREQASAKEPGLWFDVDLIEEAFVDESRWFNVYDFIYHIPKEGRWVVVKAGIGKTEYQDENEIYEAYEAVPHEKITIEYIRRVI